MFISWATTTSSTLELRIRTIRHLHHVGTYYDSGSLHLRAKEAGNCLIMIATGRRGVVSKWTTAQRKYCSTPTREHKL
jgi:hypothetical protein